MDQTSTVKVSKRYQIAVPANARRQLNIHSGDQLLVDIQDGMLILLPSPSSYTYHLSGLHKEIWEGVETQAYLDQERQAWEESPHGSPPSQ
jgi:AbrB family looped-hinge helix DNA binding protein